MRPCAISFRSRKVHARLGEIDIDAVEFPDRRQRRRLVRGHQRADGHRRGIDTAADRRADGCEIEIDAGRLHRRLGRSDIGARLQGGDLGVAKRLGADDLLCLQRLGSFELRLGIGHRPFGMLKCRDRRVVGRLQGRRVDLVEDIARLDLAALDKVAFLDDAADPRAHFGDQIGAGPPRQFGGDGRRLRAQRLRVHFQLRRWRRRALSRCLLLAARQQQRRRDGGKDMEGKAVHGRPHFECRAFARI